MTALLRWTAAGLLAALPVAAFDSLGVLPGPAGAHGGGLLGLTFALHLTVGALVGLGLGLASLATGGLTLDGAAGAARRFLDPVRAHRPAMAASALAAPIVFGGAAAVLFLVNLRFFGFNNQRLAALLLVVVTAAILGAAALAFRSLVRRLTPLARRAGERRPGLGDAPLLWLAPGAGLVCGAIAGVGLRRATAVAENWEALDLAPYVGLAMTAALAAVIEVLTRRGRPRLVLGLGAAVWLTSFGAWASALTAGLEGVDNDHLRRRSGVARLYLTLAERFTDRDRDGFSPLFGHGDCNDADPLAFPGSTEGDDCLPDVELEDAAAFEARLRGTEPPAAPTAPTSPVEPAPTPVSSTPELPVEPKPKEKEPEAPPKPTLQRPYNVVLITVDTVRADHTSLLGYERETTPNLDALGERSAVFERAYAPSNMTPISIPAMLSGRYTSELYRDDSHFIRFDERNTFLAEMLADAGVETRAVMTHWYFEKRKRAGLDQGFDGWTVVGTRWGKEMEDVSTSELVSTEAIEQLRELDGSRPFFLWLHFLDPHKWYVFHDGFEKRWGRSSKDRYDHEIAFTDHHIGRVLGALKTHPAADRTAVIVTSDHGEAFGEHKTAFHGFSMYEDQLWVPLLVHVPGLPGRRIDKRVGLIDLTPTVLDLMGVQPPERLQGRSWGPDLLGDTLPQRLIYAERVRGPHSAGMRALIDGDLKLIWRAAGNRYELYDLAKDPGELTDLMRSDPEAAEKMTRAMASMIGLALDTKGKVR